MKRLLLALLVCVALPETAAADRLWSTGWELGTQSASSTAAAMEHRSGGGTHPTVISSSPAPRSGVYAGKTDTAASGTEYFNRRQTMMAAGEQFYGRAYIYITDYPDSTTWIACFCDSVTATNGWGIAMTSTGALQLVYNPSSPSQVGSNSSALSLNTWYRIEWSGNFDDNACDARIDGSSFASGTCGSVVAANEIRLGIGVNDTGAANASIVWDDGAWNDNTDTANQTGQNTWPGAGSIIHLYPDGEGDSDAVITLVGCTTNEWECIDENPTPDDSTSYIALTGISSAYFVTVTDVGAAPDSDDTITLVQLGVRWASAGAGTTNVQTRMRTQASGTIASSGFTTGATSTFYVNDQNEGQPFYKLTRTTDPQGGGAWTLSLLNSLQIGALTNDANPDTWVSSEWALVEYVPVAGGGGGGDAVQDVIGPVGVIPFPRSGALEM